MRTERAALVNASSCLDDRHETARIVLWSMAFVRAPIASVLPSLILSVTEDS